MKTEVKIPVGTPTIIAPAVMRREPIIIGKIPKLAGLFDGDQSLPNKKFEMPYFAINGKPFIKIKTQIKRMATIAIAALIKNITLKKSSLNACFFTR